ncbi:MAG: GGDEF domain-containing protein [Myxococcales bacterium]|nr:GGDEF domain-containing protein [Myxococcales bacterium]
MAEQFSESSTPTASGAGERTYDGVRRERPTVPVPIVSRRRRTVPQREANLIVLRGSGVGQLLSLRADHCYLGRDDSATITLDDPGISRLHAAIRRDAEGLYHVEDLGSRNGTAVNGRALLAPRQLERGDKIALGLNTVLRFSLEDELETDYAQRMYDAALRDGLTGAHNRRYFDERITEELAFAQRHGGAISLLLLDIDHFKRINDTRGHPVGDEVLRELTRRIMHCLRAEDVFARYGGEEFAIVCRDIDADAAVSLAERIRAMIARAPVPVDGEDSVAVTVSIGTTTFQLDKNDQARETVDFTTPQRLVASADDALLAAKRAGRNRVRAGREHKGPVG